MLFLVHFTSNKRNISSQNGAPIFFFRTIFERWSIECASSLGVARVTLFYSKWSRLISSSSVLGALSLFVSRHRYSRCWKKRVGKIWREQTREDCKSRPSSNACLSKHQWVLNWNCSESLLINFYHQTSVMQYTERNRRSFFLFFK